MRTKRFTHGQALLSVLCILLGPGLALADGGAIQAMQTDGGLLITVFTSPAIVTAGEVDISVLVQDAGSKQSLTSAEVEILVTPRFAPYLAERHPATDEFATNQLLKVSHVELAEGWHDLAVTVRDRDRQGRVECAVFAAPAAARAASFWPWFTWPAVPLALVAANLTYRRWQSRRGRQPSARRTA